MQKLTILTLLASATVAQAQVWSSKSWDFTGWDHATITGGGSQSFDVFRDGSLKVTVTGKASIDTKSVNNEDGITSSVANSEQNIYYQFTLSDASAVSIGIHDLQTKEQTITLNTISADFKVGEKIGDTELPSGGGPNEFKYSGGGGVWTDSYAHDVVMFELTHIGGAATDEAASFTFQSVAIPEPSSTALLGAGFMTFLLIRKRK